MGSGNNDVESYVDYSNGGDTNNELGSSEYHFGRMVFYDERAENDTDILSRMRFEGTPTSSPSPSVLEDIVADAAAALIFSTSTVRTGKGHRHHHHNIHFDSESRSIIGSSGGIKATRRLINTAASMAAGVIDSVATSSSPYPQQYYEGEVAAGIFPSIVSTTGVANDQISDLTMNDTFNSSLAPTWPVRDPLYITIPITVIYIIILLIGLLGNVVTCIVIVRSRYLHTTTNYYLFSLAISDLLLLLSGLPVEMYSIWKRYPYIFGEYFCIGRGLAAETSSNATVLTITAFTIERYLAICRPFMIQKWQNKLSRVVRQILIIWLISISLAVPQALQFGVVEGPIGNNQNSTFCYPKQPLIDHSFEIATFVFFVAPMILITVLYCLIGLTLRNASNVKESKLRLRKSLSNHKREVGQQRVLKMLVAVVVAFFVCWAPFHAQRLIVSFLRDDRPALQMTYNILIYVSGVLYYLSTCINPILYHIMSLKFRHAFQENVNKCCGERYRKRQRRERELLVGPPSLSHSSHSRSQGIVLTEITPMTLCSNSAHANCHHHHHNHHHHHQINGSVRTNATHEVKFQGSDV